MKNRKHPWFRQRRYLHFDRPVSLRHAKSIVKDPKQVAAHAFYPFIYSVVSTPRISRDPATRRLIKKTKLRDICYAAHADSHIYAYYGWRLGQKYEEILRQLGLHSCVLAFRSIGESNITFAKRAFNEIIRRESCDVLAFDIKGFFDNLDPRLLKTAWTRVLGLNTLPPDHYAIFRSLVKWGRVHRKRLLKELGISIHNPGPSCRRTRRICSPKEFRERVRGSSLLESNRTGRGIPQGSPMSAVLSNIYMLDFDEKMQRFAASTDSVYMRYCDDMIVIAPPGTSAAVKAFVDARIQEVGLELQHEKTEELSFTPEIAQVGLRRPLQYLGFCFDGRKIWIRASSMSRFHQRMRRGVRMMLRASARRNDQRVLAGRPGTALHRKTLYRRYSYLGRRNFVSYGFRSADILKTDEIKHQMKPLWRKLQRRLKPHSS